MGKYEVFLSTWKGSGFFLSIHFLNKKLQQHLDTLLFSFSWRYNTPLHSFFIRTLHFWLEGLLRRWMFLIFGVGSAEPPCAYFLHDNPWKCLQALCSYFSHVLNFFHIHRVHVLNFHVLIEKKSVLRKCNLTLCKICDILFSKDKESLLLYVLKKLNVIAS